MSTQHTPAEALRLAEWLECRQMAMLQDRQAAAELRRLHDVNTELLAALKEIEWSNDDTWRTERARAAIAKATGSAA